jgi:hypothetical protein
MGGGPLIEISFIDGAIKLRELCRPVSTQAMHCRNILSRGTETE